VPSSDPLTQNPSHHLDALLRTLVSVAADVGRVALDLLVVLALTYFFVTDADLGERLPPVPCPRHHSTSPRASNLLDMGTGRHWPLLCFGFQR
jgi:hypothetical protein